jgi:disease resistance protein RPM1
LTAGLLAALANLKDLQHLKLIADVLDDFIIEDKTFPGLLHLCFVLECATLPTIEEGALPYLISLKLICKDLVGLADIEINRLTCLKEVSLDHRVAPETRETWEKAAKEHPNRPKVLLVNAADESEIEAADCSVASTPTVSGAKETSLTSEVPVQEDDIQMIVNQGPSSAPEKQNNCAVQPSSKDELNSAFNNIGFPEVARGLTELTIARNGNVSSYTY